ncbi:MAG TPA: DUF4126 domain-containing protein [Bacteroidetes bacterium]|nr:DUF4126 domain-containing protein [Ignavibacteria bacterium]HCA43266.1 DUF4126 domain-containing protein [Bacteroidota bacterium]HCN37570.1 DUF4126 domain-containing protein [Bacteroidota bacterium]
MEYIIPVLIGIGLAAACGFRVFVPLLLLSVFSHTGYMTPSEDFVWVGTVPALICFSVATLLEVGAYYIPWLDNLFDSIATPLAAIAGIFTSLAVISDLDPMLKWSTAVILGGGSASLFQILTVKARAVSSTITAGFGNFIVSTVELFISIVVSLLSIIAPVIAITTLIGLIIILIYYIRKHIKQRRNKPTVIRQ